MTDSRSEKVAARSEKVAARYGTESSPDRRAFLGARAFAWGFVAAGIALPLAFAVLAGGSPRTDRSSSDARLSRYLHGLENDGSLVNLVLDVLLSPAVQVIGLVALVAVAGSLIAANRLRAAVFLALAVGAAVVAAPLLKDVFNRAAVNPQDPEHVFPSGHAMRSMAAVAALACTVRDRRHRRVVIVVGAAYAVLTGIALVYNGWHWPSDVLGAWCVSVAWVAALFLALRPLAHGQSGTPKTRSIHPRGGRAPQANEEARPCRSRRSAGRG
jgi:membrane-associated phospholipid phosphatase